MKPICFIPARGGSKGIRGKNIRKLCNKPLLAYTIESALSSKLFQHVVVSTEDPKIARIANEYGAETSFLRPKRLARDNTTTEAVLVHGISQMNKLGYELDIIMLRDCTVPFIDAKDMKGALNLLTKKKCDAVFGAIKAHPNPYFGMMEFDKNGFLIKSKTTKLEITRRQDSPTVYDVDGMFIFYLKNFMKTQKISSGKILPFELTKEHGHMIDFEFDFKVAELLIKNSKLI